MSDSRTDEQKLADDALTSAIETVIAAYSGESHEYPLLTDYLVISVQRGWADDGDAVSAVGMFPRDGNLPVHVELGMVDYVAARLRQRIGSGEGL